MARCADPVRCVTQANPILAKLRYTVAMVTRASVCAAMILAPLAASCGSSPTQVETPPSEPTDAFYRREAALPGETPPTRWNDRQPARTFDTSLRPWAVQARLPTPYLFRVTRHHQPWAGRIYDEADMVFGFGSLQPIQPQSITALVQSSNNDDAVRLTLGGWARSHASPPELVADIYDAPIIRTAAGVEVKERPNSSQFYRSAPNGQIDGQPIALHCGPEQCRAELAIPPTSISPPPPAVDPTVDGGIRLSVEFHRRRLEDWPEVRRKSLCFAALSIIGFRFERAFANGWQACRDVARQWPVAISPHQR